MVIIQYAKAFPDMRINAVDPGFTQTDLNGNTGTQTVEQGTQIIVQMAQVGPDGPPAASSTPKAACPGNGWRLSGQFTVQLGTAGQC